MEKKHNRNKLPLVLVALLTLSLIAYGSFAYFTDSTTHEGGLQLKLGHIVIESEDGGWVYEADTPNLQLNAKGIQKTDNSVALPNNDGQITVSNARPGDKFTRKITIGLDSTLDSILTFNNGFNLKNDENKGPFKISVKPDVAGEYKMSNEDLLRITKEYNKGENGSFSVPIGPAAGKVTFDIVVEVMKESDANHNTNKETVSLDQYFKQWAEKAITVQAVQESHAEQ